MEDNSDNATTLAENKVLILYVLKQINSDITESGLFKIISSISKINYFYFKQFLTDLINSKLVDIDLKDNEQLIKLSPEGKISLSLNEEILPGIVKLKVNNTFRQELSNINNETSVSSEIFFRSENEYTVKCKIIENNETIFEVKTFAGSQERAQKIVDNWKNNATKIYPQILNILLRLIL